MSRSLVTLLVLGTSMALVSCSQEPAGPDESTVGVVHCASPRPDRDRQHVEYRQDGGVVASAELEGGTTYRAEVPADELTEIYVDGRLVGSSGDDETDPDGGVSGGYAALLGDGCPEYDEP